MDDDWIGRLELCSIVAGTVDAFPKHERRCFKELLSTDVSRLHVDQQERRVLIDRAPEYGCTHGMTTALTRRDGRETVLELTVVAVPVEDDEALLVIARPARARDGSVKPRDAESKDAGVKGIEGR